MLSKKRLITALLLCTMSVLLACDNLLDIDSTHVASETKQWESLTDTRSGLMGVYGLFRAGLADNNAHWMYGELRMGDFEAYKRQDLKAIKNNQLNAAFPVLQELSDWRRFYAVINAAAVFMEKAPKVREKDPRYSEQNLQLDLAQARALRAFAYFCLARVWGDVPLIKYAYDNGSFEAMPQADVREVLNYAESELLAAAADLPYLYGVSPQTYYGQGETAWSGVLINKVSAYAILAHIAAWKGNYVDAEVYAGFVMDNYSRSKIAYSNVTTLTSVTGLFSRRSASQMVAFGFQDVNGEATQSGHIEDLTLAQPFVAKPVPDIYIPKATITSIFDSPYDLRFGIDTVTQTYRTNYFTNLNGEAPVFSKIKVIRDGVSKGTYALFGSALIFTRMEEITLLRAEALAALNRYNEAILLLNRVRSERGLSLYEDNADYKVLDAIFDERRRELMGEGWRWFDQVRYQRLTQENPAFTQLIENKGIYWPVANRVLASNSLLVQNSYWR